uniref:C3H1-type domain-containing protein n=1 Tax=Trichuris muris TaxID=70415 RepID=A0A5S6Q4D1_TRIMR
MEDDYPSRRRLDLCPAESTSVPPQGGAPLSTDLAQSSAKRTPFDLTKDGGDSIGALLGQKAEEQVPVFSGEPTEYPAWEEAIAPIRFCPFRQPIMKFNAIKKGEALDIVKWIGMDQPNPVESLVDALKREYGRAEIVIRAQEARLDKLEPPEEDDYPSLRNFVIAVRSCLATMKAHGYNVEDNPQFTRQLERKLNWTLIKRWCQKKRGETPKHLLEFQEMEADILQKAYLFKPGIIPKRRTVAMEKPKERALIGLETSREGLGEVLTGGESVKSTNSLPRDRMGGVKCPKCGKDHLLFDCKKFISLSVGMRLAEAKRLGVHYRCLTKHKLNGNCPIPFENQRCQVDLVCKYRHHELLHWQRRQQVEDGDSIRRKRVMFAMMQLIIWNC